MNNHHPRFAFRHCLRCGSSAVFYKQDNSLCCKECDFRYYINSAAAVAILIVNSKGELLLTRRAFAPQKDKLDLPGGFVDIGESAEAAVERELKEELNIVPRQLEYINSYPNEYIYSNVTVFTLDMAFFCLVDDFSAIKAKDDVASYDFYPLNEIDFDEIAFDSIRNIVKEFYRKIVKGNIKSLSL